MKRNLYPSTVDVTSDTASITLRSLYMVMLRIRKFEERTADIITTGEIKCPTHLYIGQEAIAAGVCAHLRKDDYVFSTHRSHGHYMAKGGDIKAMMAEMYGKVTGCSRGRGGSMHLASPELGLPGSSAIVAGTIPVAVGAALAFSMMREDRVAVVFFGEGAVCEGVFYESLNLASLMKLPVIFVCENNMYATHMPISANHADTSIYEKANAFNMPGVKVDGNNVMEVYGTAENAIEDARAGRGPSLIECTTYRWRGHVGPSYDVGNGLRTQEELDYWMDKCPIRALESFLVELGILSEAERTQIDEELNKEVEEAVTFAKDSPYPDESELLNNVFKS